MNVESFEPDFHSHFPSHLLHRVDQHRADGLLMGEAVRQCIAVGLAREHCQSGYPPRNGRLSGPQCQAQRRLAQQTLSPHEQLAHLPVGQPHVPH
ncbi:hypothetical protein G6F45_013835 [Rhizopus arrhizus]|nr:hypothetical protein G6F45_013835 [Rhizopus arrhizus]